MIRSFLRSSPIALVVILHMACDSPTATSPSLASWSSLPKQKLSFDVSGRVIDYTTKGGVPGVTLEWSVSSPATVPSSPSSRVTTDASGTYRIALTPANAYGVRIYDALSTVMVPSLTYRTDFYVNHGGCVLIYGHVFDAVTRQPVSGASVHFLGAATTDGSGAYRIEPGCNRSYGTGTFPVTITHPGYTFPFTVGGRSEFFSNGNIVRRDFELTPATSAAR